jgi:hypothetical protein
MTYRNKNKDSLLLFLSFLFWDVHNMNVGSGFVDDALIHGATAAVLSRTRSAMA